MHEHRELLITLELAASQLISTTIFSRITAKCPNHQQSTLEFTFGDDDSMQ